MGVRHRKFKIYRRHVKDCIAQSKAGTQTKEADESFNSCRCPIWFYGYLDGVETRRSTGHFAHEQAVATASRWAQNQKVDEEG